jgi:uncharacterized protein (UPF0332 family)
MFYAVLALLISVGQGASKHARVIALFDQHFVKPGAMPKETSRWLHRAFELCQRGDYLETTALDATRTEEVLRWARQFVEQATMFLQSNPLPDNQRDG